MVNRRLFEYQGAPNNIVACCRTCDQLVTNESGELAVFVDGACSGNGTSRALAGIGVYRSPESHYNISRRLGDGPHTNQRAEILAAVEALSEIAQNPEVLGCNHHANGVVIISDSTYVVDAMTIWITTWKQNGWKTWNGTSVQNAEVFKLLEEFVAAFENKNLRVPFCHVPREFNLADPLAKRAVN